MDIRNNRADAGLGGREVRIQYLHNPASDMRREGAERLNGVISTRLLGVSFGGGTNSTAMLCGFKERGIRPDLITFADTGSEMPHTYEHVEVMREKVKEWWGLDIHTVRKTYQGKPESLEQNCLRMKMLPGLAYGTKSCSQKFKIEVQDRLRKKFMDEQGCKEMVLAMGFDASEQHRLKERPPRDPLSSGDRHPKHSTKQKERYERNN